MMNTLTDEEIDRTPPLGLFNFAESYRTAADILASQHTKELRFDSPVRYLYYHAIELYMKAFLRSGGLTTKAIKDKLGHRFTRMRSECISMGLNFDGFELTILDYIGDDYMDARYLETGTKQVVAIEQLSLASASIARKIGEHFKESGMVLQVISQSPFTP